MGKKSITLFTIFVNCPITIKSTANDKKKIDFFKLKQNIFLVFIEIINDLIVVKFRIYIELI